MTLLKKIFCIGEALIDFIPIEKDHALKDVASFERVAGGAPMNVAIAVAKYDGHAVMLTKLANDSFGDYLFDILQENGVDTTYIIRSDEGETGLAFVSVDASGERDFSFYRKNAADLLLAPEDVQAVSFEQGDLLHFCSVDLVESPMKQTHRQVIEAIRAVDGIVSFDPNVRLPLWPNKELCRQTILDFLPTADIIKVSDEELHFITNIEDEAEAIRSLFVGHVQVIVYTKGADGAIIYLKTGEVFEGAGFQVTVSDTTGAGDAFIGGFLAELLSLNVSLGQLDTIIRAHHQQLLTFANASGALTASVKGAIHAAPGRKHVLTFIDAQQS
ncbi:carbohydrate kinase family protein [Lysinibacillus piscis]|uniref:carbohydrate kinase family protein n=1 Tax=Lysinibacillus piscis TaxID=2518931 RepID=UPI002852A1A4|nr:carbohydrate kinase [Lysinibacillus sp. KH24]